MKSAEKFLAYPETVFLHELFAKLKRNNVQYSVLRNYDNLPYHTGGSDIDMLISINSWHKAQQIIDEIVAENNGKCIAKLKAGRILHFAICGRNEGTWWGVRFDTFKYAGTNGCDILSSESILARSFFYNGVCVASNSDSAILSFVKEVIGAGRDQKKYRVSAYNALQEDYIHYSTILSHYFGKKIFSDVILPLIEGRDNNLSSAKFRLRKCWRTRFFLRHPFLFFKRLVVDIWYKLARLIWPPGFAVAFLGTDGSGKSTIIGQIIPPLEAALHTKIRYEHMRPNLLPSIARLFGRRIGKEAVDSPHKSRPSGFIGSILRLSYYSLDYIVGYWLKVHLDRARRTCLWFFDRYYYDYLIDPFRGRISLPNWITKLLSFFVPKPDLVLVFGCDPLIIHRRKPELHLGEVERQVCEFKNFCSKMSNAVWVDTGCSIERSVDQALEAITSAMAVRYRRKI